jgi:hypothetical protein
MRQTIEMITKRDEAYWFPPEMALTLAVIRFTKFFPLK